MTVPFPPLIFSRPSLTRGQVDLYVVTYDGNAKREQVFPLHPDKAVTLGLDLARMGWQAKLKGAP